MRTRIAAAVLATVALALTACTASPNSGGDSAPAELSIATIGPPESFAPGSFSTGPSTLYMQPVYDTLLRNDNDGEPQPSIATEWSFNDAQTELTLTLRDDVKFTDGASLDAGAVKANLEFAQQGTGDTAGQLKFIDTVEATDATHVKITLSAPDPSLLPNLGGPAGSLASPEALGTEELKTQPVGSGPYVLDQSASQTGVKYIYTRNDDYWNAEDFPFDGIEITIFNDSNAILNALRSGQVDFSTVTQKDADSLESAGLTIESFPAYTVSGLFLFDREGTLVPALADVRVRQALNLAIDKDAIFEGVYGGVGTPTSQVFSVSSEVFDPALDETYAYNVEKAKELLAEAGYPDGFALPMPDVSPIFPETQAAFTEALTAIGVTPEYQPVNGETFISDLLSAKYPAAIFGLNTYRPWDFAQYALTPDALWNTFHVADPTIVSLVDQAQTQTGEEQTATFRELNEYVLDQAWFAANVQSNNVFALSSDISVTPQMFSTIPPIWNIVPAD